MGNALSIEPAIELASREFGKHLKSLQVLATEVVNLASGHGDEKLQSVQVVVNEAVKLISKEMDDKLRVANVMAVEAIVLGTSEMDRKIELVNAIVDKQRAKLLSSAIAFVYFNILLAYALFSRSTLGKVHHTLLSLQLVILSMWLADLMGGVKLPFVEHYPNRDGYFMMVLTIVPLVLIFSRGASMKERNENGGVDHGRSVNRKQEEDKGERKDPSKE